MGMKIDTLQFLKLLPVFMQNDEAAIALSKTVSQLISVPASRIKTIRVWDKIDELTEPECDELAWEFDIDWYDSGAALEQKRATIKDVQKIKRKRGTPYSLLAVARSAFPQSEIEEWFDYDGTPYCFRIVIDMTNARAPAEYFRISRIVNLSKRLSAHLDGIVYQASVTIKIGIGTQVFKYQTGRTGKYKAGTEPRRNTVGVISDHIINIQTDNESFGFHGVAAGTKPHRSIIGAVVDSEIEIYPESAPFIFHSDYSGTKPHRTTIASLSDHDINIKNEPESFLHSFVMTGGENSGTKPRRTTSAGLHSQVINIKNTPEIFPYSVGMTGKYNTGEEPQRNASGGATNSDINIQSKSEPFTFHSDYSGTKPQRSTGFNHNNSDVSAITESEVFLFSTGMAGRYNAGTEPDRQVSGGADEGGIMPDVTVEAFSFTVKMCGTSRCKN